MPRVPQDLTRHDCLRYSYLAAGEHWNLQAPDGSAHAIAAESLRQLRGQEASRPDFAVSGYDVPATLRSLAEPFGG